jgi:uncharacterized protein (TIGR01777 family)
MKILMTGGTGFVGSILTRDLTRANHRITVLTRSIRPGRSLPAGAEFLEGDPVEPGPWQDRVPEHDAILNLAGASIFTRWTKRTKEVLRESRLRTTRNLVEALARNGQCAGVRFLSTSAVGYYGFSGDEERTEESPPGDDFLATLARDWEREALEARGVGARVTLLRFGVVLDGREGALARMIPLFRKCLGSPLGTGEQWFSWIHVRDLAAIYRYLLERGDVEGPVNCTAPNPVRNRELTRALAEALGRPAFLPAVPGVVMRVVLGEFANVLLRGQRAIPGRLLDAGFHFEFNRIGEALRDVIDG